MVKIHSHVTGNTLNCHEVFLEKLCKRGAKVVDSPDDSEYILLFCPIVTRFQTDVNAALSEIADKERKVIVVAMHHTFDPNYTLPDMRRIENHSVKLLVDCLFHETKGFYRCAHNSKAKKMVYKELGIKNKVFWPIKLKKEKRNKFNQVLTQLNLSGDEKQLEKNKRASSDVFCWTEEKDRLLCNSHQCTFTKALNSLTSLTWYYGFNHPTWI